MLALVIAEVGVDSDNTQSMIDCVLRVREVVDGDTHLETINDYFISDKRETIAAKSSSLSTFSPTSISGTTISFRFPS